MKQTNINIDEIKRFPTVTNPIKADDLHTCKVYQYSPARCIVTDYTDEQRADLLDMTKGRETADGIVFASSKYVLNRLHSWQNHEAQKQRAAILGEGWQWIEGLNHGTQPGDVITCTDGTRGRVTKADPESCVIEFETEDGQRLNVAGYFRYTPSAKSETPDERKGIMKTYDIDVHFDASITMHGIIAESEEQAREIARQRAKEMNLFCAAMERHDAGEKVAESHELTAEELREEEREQVQELVPWLLEQETPTEWHYYANGGTFGWMDYESDDATEWERRLFADIANGTHPETALYNRYARMYARQKWEEHADELRRLWDAAWQQAQSDPEGTRVIVETNEEDQTAPANEFGRYYMIDKADGCGNVYDRWQVIRVDTVTSPYEVHRPNWANTHGYSDNQTQLSCRCENPNNVTRWARLMIDAGRVTDIYADCY